MGDPTGNTRQQRRSGVNAGGEISGTEYDIARVKWGDSWRMPTKAEMEELVNKCTRTTVTRNGISGVEFTGPSGNSIFLPNGGLRKETTIESQGISSFYWTGTGSSFSYGFTSQAYYMVNGGMRDHYCTNGFSVRPVSDFVTVGGNRYKWYFRYGASASSGIASNEGLTIVEKGFCYSYLKTPTTDDDKVVCQTGGNGIEAILSGLVPNSKYYVRAYVVNSKGGQYMVPNLNLLRKMNFR